MMNETPQPPVPLPGSERSLDEVADAAAAARRIDLVGAHGGSLAALLPLVVARRNRGAIVVVEDSAAARRMGQDLLQHLSYRDLASDVVLVYPDHDLSPYDELIPDRRSATQRSAVLFRLAFGMDWRFLVVPAPALLRRTLPRQALESTTMPIARGDEIDREALVQVLERGGYHRTPLVEEPGTYAVRGGLLDLFPPYLEHPARVELFGRTVENLRSFDAESQVSGAPLEEVWIHPARLALTPTDPALRERAAAAVRGICDAVDQPTARTDRLIEDLLDGRLFVGAEGLAPALHEPLGSLLDYLPRELFCCVDNPAAVSAAWRKSRSVIEADYRRRIEQRAPCFAPERFLVEDRQVEERILESPLLVSHPLAVSGSRRPALERCDEPIDLGALPTGDLGERLRHRTPAGEAADLIGALATHLGELEQAGYRIVIVAHTDGQAERLAAMLGSRGTTVDLIADGPPARRPGASVAVGELARGCLLPGEAICWIAEEEIFGRRARRRRGASRSGAALADLRSLTPGDLVVHREHGIGRYDGLVRQVVGKHEVDFLLLVYRGGDKLYLPVYRLNQVHKHRGGEGDVRLDKLGGQTFSRTKAQVRAEASMLAGRLLDLYARRSAASRPPLGPVDDLQRSFEAAFPFEETEDQLRAIDEVMADLDSGRPMDRLICGDVGFGKTEVALRAAFRVVMAGRQVAVLVPTTVLAQQHFQSFAARLGEYPIRVEMVSRFRTAAQNSEVALGLKEGTVDVVIGTHRLLSRDVHFRRLGLLVVDEEHRFGVAHKERIRELKAAVDTLVLTATPIPRTLHMAYSGLRDLSLIGTAPVDRRPIKTLVCHDDARLLTEAMERELARDGQVFYVHNRVRDIERVAERVGKMIPAARIAVGHGQLKEEELERVMLDFVAGRYDILVCTSIIESGLDIPRANTIVVDRADTFGLAQLYQIRGRVGRSHRQAYAYLVVPPLASLGELARERVEALARYTDLGSGFSVAMRDLELRGAGNLLGAEQSGDVAAVGFELYCELLAEAAAEARGEPRPPEFEPELTLERPGFVPEAYLPDVGQRLQYYKRLASAADEQEVESLAAEMHDRFGKPPEEVETLLQGMKAKAYCRLLHIPGIELRHSQLIIHLGTESLVEPEVVAAVVRETEGRVSLKPDLRIVARFDDALPGGPDGLIRILRRLGSYDNNPLIL